MKFIGSYVNEQKAILTASAVSGLNVMEISEPGWGKSEMALDAANAISGGNGVAFIELSPSTPPERITGSTDVAEYLKSGTIRPVVKNTPYDPDLKICILDEIGRISEIVADTLVHATSNKNVPEHMRPVFWGTSNFPLKGDRTAALNDRFALWYYMRGDMDVKSLSMAHLNNGSGHDASFTAGMPTWDDCLKIRSEQLTPRAAEAVGNLVEQLANAVAESGSFKLNPRRVVQWTHLLSKVTIFKTGTGDFTSVHPDAAKLLKYCYPCTDSNQAGKWMEIALSVGDAIGAAIESAYALAKEKIDLMVGQMTAESRTSVIVELGTVIAQSTDTLEKIGGNDPRVREFKTELMQVYQNAVIGRK